ncbi:MAG: head-tail joining protein [Phage 5P_3]|nr:MAG: head-tail joining protein [Phage 5P_3]
MMDAADLTWMRAAQAATMTTACTVRRTTNTADGLGGQTPSTASVATTCRLAPTGGQELEIAARLTALTTVTITLPYNTDVLAGDEIVIGAVVYRVIAVLAGGTIITALRTLAVRAQ